MAPPRADRGAIRLDVVNRTRCRLPGRRLLLRAAGLALTPLFRRSRGREVATTLVCVGGRTMRRLNRRFTGRDCITDVLSFEELALDRENVGCFRAGEVVICSEAARRHVCCRGDRMRQELLLYAVHGWLHVAGYRDGTAAARARMVRAERRVMAVLGFERPD